MRVGALALVLVLGLVVVVAAPGCRKPTERASGRTKEVVFGNVKLTVAEETEVEEVSGVLALNRPGGDRMKRDRLTLSPESAQQFAARTGHAGGRLALPHGELAYGVDRNAAGGKDLTLRGEMKIEPDAYFYVNCDAFAVDGKEQPMTAWCLPVLQTTTHR